MFNLPLTKRYIPAVIIIALFVIGTNILSHKVINSNDENAKIINISGKQRMLSQRLVIVASNFKLNPNQKNELELNNTLDEIETSHRYLLTKIFTQKLQNMYFEEGLDKNLNIYLSNFHQLLKTKDKMYIDNARDNSKEILIQLDKAVKEYEKYANSQLDTLSQYEFYLMLATLFVLILEIIFIFRPASKKIEEKAFLLELKEEYEATVIESNNNAIIALDWTGKITTYNKKAEDIFGWSKEEMIDSRNLLNIIPPKYKQLHTNAFQKYLNSGKSCGIIDKVHELEGVRKDGSIFPLQISFGAKWKLKGAIVVASIIDMTKQKEQEVFMMQQSKMASMGEMIGNIAHQWRQPLSAISTSASGTIVEQELGLVTQEDIKIRLLGIIDKTNFLSQTIDDFRNFFKRSKEKEIFSVNDVITNVKSIIHATYNHDRIIFKTNYDVATKIYCVGFANELSQVLINIFNNAKDVLVEKECIDKIVKVSLTKKDDNVRIKIYDSAGGIPNDIISKVFEPYFTTKHQSQGTGIGLYMSREIINGHFEGSLTVSNMSFEVDGKEYFGACFEINILSGTK